MEFLSTLIENNPYFRPVVYILGSILIGVIVQTIVVQRLIKLSKRTKWEWDDIVIKSLGNAPVIWFFTGGAYMAIVDSKIDQSYKTLVWQGLLIIFVLSVAMVLSKITVGVINSYSEKSQNAFPGTSIFTLLTKAIIYTLAALVVLQTFGISITPFLTALGVGGLAVALALQETLGNLFAGLHLIASKKFRPGDYVELENGESGYIEDISWRNITIRTLGNNLIIMPNAKMAGATLTNYSRPQKDMSVLVDVGVSYGSDLKKVEEVTVEVAKETMHKVEGAVEDFDPFIRFHTFGDSSINLTVILRVQEFVNQYLVKHEFVKALHERYAKEGIEIPFPQRDIHQK